MQSSATGLHLRDAVSKGGLLSLGRHVRGADQKIDSNRAVVDLDAIEGGCRLVSLLSPVEDDGGASKALAIRSVLHQDPLGPANTDSRGEVVL